MSGQILTAVAALVVRGLRGTEAAALVDEADLGWLREDLEAVPLGPYRALLDEVFQRYGGTPILAAGMELRHVRHPLLFVLLNSDRPELLIQKEARLSAYIHSRHRVRVVASDPDGIVLEHASSHHDPARPTENLASCGQHVAMLEMIGARRLSLSFPRSANPAAPVYSNESVHLVPDGGGYDLWHFQWERFVPTRAPMDGLDAMLMDRARLAELHDRPGIAAAVERMVREDLGGRWVLERVARALFMSKRTLQRRLAVEGLTFSDLMLEIRVSEAARLLRESELSVTAIGYICGFADTSHFSHSFKRRHGSAPGVWREGAGPT